MAIRSKKRTITRIFLEPSAAKFHDERTVVGCDAHEERGSNIMIISHDYAEMHLL